MEPIQHRSIHRFIHYPTIGSTNTEALSRRKEWPGENVLIVADEQTSGRGRLQRKWHSPAGTGLWLTLLIRDPVTLKQITSQFSLYAGLMVSRTLEAYSTVSPGVKWPNDVLLAGRKVAGILTEAVWQGDRIDALALGIGINLHGDLNEYPVEIRTNTATVEMFANEPVHARTILMSLTDILFHNLSLLEDDEHFAELWAQNCPFLHQEVQINTPVGPLKGLFEGVDTLGRARLRSDDCVHTVLSGDQIFRR